MVEDFEVRRDTHDGFSNIDTIQFNWAIQSGSISEMSTYLNRERDGGLYDFHQAFDYVALQLLKEIRNKRLLKTIRTNNLYSLSGDDLVEFSKMVGLPFFEGYPYDSFKNQILQWSQNPNGGTKPVMRGTLYNFMGSGTFLSDFDPENDNTQIHITIPNEGSVEWGTTGEVFDSGTNTKWGSLSADIEYDEWDTTASLSTESFVVEITLYNSGTTSERDTYQYWSQDSKRATLQKLIDSVKPVGFNNTLKIQQGF